ncbi:hypothetical protein [Paraburkholderia sp. BL17N1]|uniref:hypothetical protein n=1 Tax=Paraburkholderia sp. BL17N1 TaxID=1938798 RepID=UPI000EB2EC3A|nr:hypothetical protein [Paraburkholderia sp. BL17N1]RKR38617.1 hypothetical protein B0G82_6770 [Paraburkholderia sp. BL17N1]
MGLLDRIFFRQRARTGSEEERRTSEAVGRVLAMNPRLRNARHYEERLTRVLKTSLNYTDSLVASLPRPRDANADAWSSDPMIRALFATPDDLAQAFSRSEELRAFFEENADSAEAYAVLGMAMNERHVLGVALEGDSIRRDVPQTTLCFSDHRVRICSGSEASLRGEIARRMVDQLALEGFASLAGNRRDLLRQSRALIEERVALLERQGTGMRAVVGAPSVTESDELGRLQTLMQENSQALAKLRVPAQQSEIELECVCNVFSKPSDHFYVQSRHVRVDAMNVVHPEGSEAGQEIEFHFARIPGNPAVVRAFVLVRFPRRELLPGGLHIDAAMRAL